MVCDCRVRLRRRQCPVTRTTSTCRPALCPALRALLDRCRAAAAAKTMCGTAAAGKPAGAELPLRPARHCCTSAGSCAPRTYSRPTGKRAVVLSHELTMTGAPIVLVSAIPVLRSLGYEVVVLALGRGLSAALSGGRSCRGHPPRMRDLSHPVGAGFQRRLVLANTVVEAPAVRTLNGGFVGAVVAARRLCRLSFITHKDPQGAGRQRTHCRCGLPRHRRHALGAAQIQGGAADLRPARLRPRELPSLRP